MEVAEIAISQGRGDSLVAIRPFATPSCTVDSREWFSEIAAIASGSERALSALYEGTNARIHGYALWITRMPHSAAEVTVDVYLQVWRKAHLYDPIRASVIAWMFGICRNRAIDDLRRKDEAVTCPDPESLASREIDDAEQPESRAIQAELSHAIRCAMDFLVPVQRQLLSLAYYRGLTHCEIALQSGLPLGTVKTQIRAALRTLRTTIEPLAG